MKCTVKSDRLTRGIREFNVSKDLVPKEHRNKGIQSIDIHTVSYRYSGENCYEGWLIHSDGFVIVDHETVQPILEAVDRKRERGYPYGYKEHKGKEVRDHHGCLIKFRRLSD